MLRADLITDLVASLHDAATFLDGNVERQLDIAVEHFSSLKPRTLAGSITLQAGVSEYDVPADLVAYKNSRWGVEQRKLMKPYHSNFPRTLPRVSKLDSMPAKLVFSFAPTGELIRVLGSRFDYFYYAAHEVNDDVNGTTVSAVYRRALLVRAQAEVMLEVSLQRVSKTGVRDPHSGQTRIGHPASLHKSLLEEFIALCA